MCSCVSHFTLLAPFVVQMLPAQRGRYIPKHDRNPRWVVSAATGKNKEHKSALQDYETHLF